MKTKYLKAAAAVAAVSVITLLGTNVSAEGWDGRIDVDWNAVSERLDGASPEQNVDVLAGVAFTIPAGVLRKTAGQGATLACHVGAGIGTGVCISVSAEDIGDGAGDRSVTISGEPVIPEAASGAVTEGVLVVVPLEIGGKEAFDPVMNLHVAFDARYAGKVATLYSYDEQGGGMRYDESCRVMESGQTMFALERGDEYLITVTDRIPAGTALGYAVVSGDNLSGIAARNGITLKALLAANAQIQDPDRIYPGDVIRIPGR